LDIIPRQSKVWSKVFEDLSVSLGLDKEEQFQRIQRKHIQGILECCRRKHYRERQ
jgi:hypothetical protein